jgi:AraC family transcriptional regulator
MEVGMELFNLIEHSIHLVEQEMHIPWDLESMAKKLNLSKFYFHRLFTAVVGESFSRYVLSRRLNRSLTLILEDQLTLTEIAYHLGFGTQASFTRAFKRFYGIAPSRISEIEPNLSFRPMAQVVRREFKNLRGGVIADFKLVEFNRLDLIGVVFEINLAHQDFSQKIPENIEHFLARSSFSKGSRNRKSKCYLLYSDCKPESPVFKVCFGITCDAYSSGEIQSLKANYEHIVQVNLPKMFCASFKYPGNLLDLGDVFKTDMTQVLKLSKIQIGDGGIELFQEFDSVDALMDDYRLFVPLKEDSI